MIDIFEKNVKKVKQHLMNLGMSSLKAIGVC